MNTKTKQKIDNVRMEAHRISERYNGDNDIIPGAPRVLYTEMQLLEMIKSLCDVMDRMEDRINGISGSVYPQGYGR